jgi:C1A family cysteine protease
MESHWATLLTYVTVAVVLCAAAKRGSVNTETRHYSSISLHGQRELFEIFKSDYGKSYTTSELEEEKFEIFQSFLREIDKRNEDEQNAGGSATHGITAFADFSKHDFKKLYLSSLVDRPSHGSDEAIVVEVDRFTGSETSVNWSDVYTTSINDQGLCGACWAFSVTEQIESDAIRVGHISTSEPLSTAQILAW